MADLIVKSRVKDNVPEGMRVSADLADALDKKAEEILKKAAERATANKRTTIMAQDL
jgi:histone H3/H4